MKYQLADGTYVDIIDDPVKPDAKPIDPELMAKWWEGVDKSKIAVCLTDWHPDDFSARLLKKARGE